MAGLGADAGELASPLGAVGELLGGGAEVVGIILESDGPPTSPGPGIRSFVNLPQGGGVAELIVSAWRVWLCGDGRAMVGRR